MDKIDELVKAYNSKAKANIITLASDILHERNVIPFSSPALNYETHGGLPLGRVVEFFGLEGSGKSTTALDFIANAQRYFKAHKMNKRVIYADVEQSFDADWAKTLGVDIDSLIVINPQEQTASDILQLLDDMISTGDIGLVILDSVAAFTSDAEAEKKLGEDTRGGIAKLLGAFLRKTIPLLRDNDCTLIAINQERATMSTNPYSDPYTTPGGLALKFFASARFQFARGAFLDNKGGEMTVHNDSDKVYGVTIRVRLRKSKIFKPDRPLAQYSLNYLSGIDAVNDLVSMLINFGSIQQRGSFFQACDENGVLLNTSDGKEARCQGRANFVELVRKDDKLRKALEDEAAKLSI